MREKTKNKREYPKPIQALPLWSLQRTIKECLKQNPDAPQKAWEVIVQTKESSWTVTLQLDGRTPTQPNNGPSLLSEREMEVLELLANGFTAQDISHELGIAFDTVRTHRRNLRRKLGIRDRSSRSLLRYQFWWKKLS